MKSVVTNYLKFEN